MRPSAPTGAPRLYVLYCGEAKIPDISPWSPGVNIAQPAVFSDNCYRIRHGDASMLWDSGYPDAIADLPDGIAGPVDILAYRTRTRVSQMAEIGVAPNQVACVNGLTLEGDEALLVGVMGGSVSSVQLAESICSPQLMTLQAVH